MPTMEEIFPELRNAKVFTTVDTSKGFWEIPLNYDSSLLTTFWTSYGRYRRKRVLFGVKPAPKLCQKVKNQGYRRIRGYRVHL